MKTKIVAVIMTCLFAGSANILSAQNATKDMKGHNMNMSQSSQTAKPVVGKTDSVKVMGNCGQCKTRIEKAAMSVSGVKSANWDKKTKLLYLVYTGDNKTVDVQKAIAKAGHDTGPYKATKEAYNALPGCCQYRDE